MSNCHSFEPFVTPYVDGDIAEADRRAVDEHLRACAPCHSRVAAERAVRDVVRARAPELKRACGAPDALTARCADLARLSAADDHARLKPRAPLPMTPSTTMEREASAERRGSWRARLVPVSLAASLVAVVGGAFVYQATEYSPRVMAAELTADHIKCFAMNRMLGTHHDAGAVETSMASGFGWQMQLPAEPARAGLELVGARPCLYGEGKIAHIMYRQDGRPVSLFMLPRSARSESLIEVLGHEAAVWCVGNRTFVLIAKASKPEVQRLASFVQASLR